MVVGLVAADVHFVLGLIPESGLLFGLMLVAAIIGGYVAHGLHIPRVVGYLVAGGTLRFLLYWVLGIEAGGDSELELDAATQPLKAITDLGLGIILFSIGGVFESRHLKSIGGKLSKISLAESGLTFVLVFAGTATAGMLIDDDASRSSILSFALLLGFASIATAPAATLFVLREYEAKGPVTDTILSVTGVNNIVCIVLFYLCFLLLASTGVLGEVELSSDSILVDLLTTIPGSILTGILLGFGLSILHAKLAEGETLLILVAVLIVTGASEAWLLEHHHISVNFLLTALLMGATFANLAIDPSRLEEPLRVMSRPILVGFFVIAGYRLHLGELAELPVIGATYVICRLAGKFIGAYLGIRWSKADSDLRPFLGAGLLCQAAVVIGLADFVSDNWHHAWGHRFVTVALGSVVIFEICGPLLTKWVVKRAGEVRAVTLLRRSGSATTGSTSILTLTWDALWRTLGVNQAKRRRSDDPLQVRHVMRGNVKCIEASANFDEVLHIVEQSRFNHFPVVDENQELVGIIHFSDIRGIIYDRSLANLILAVDLANPVPVTAVADMPLDEVLRIFQDGEMGSLPVVESAGSRHVVGIVEQRDVLRTVHLYRTAAQ